MEITREVGQGLTGRVTDVMDDQCRDGPLSGRRLLGSRTGRRVLRISLRTLDVEDKTYYPPPPPPTSFLCLRVAGSCSV